MFFVTSKPWFLSVHDLQSDFCELSEICHMYYILYVFCNKSVLPFILKTFTISWNFYFHSVQLIFLTLQLLESDRFHSLRLYLGFRFYPQPSAVLRFSKSGSLSALEISWKSIEFRMYLTNKKWVNQLMNQSIKLWIHHVIIVYQSTRYGCCRGRPSWEMKVS